MLGDSHGYMFQLQGDTPARLVSHLDNDGGHPCTLSDPNFLNLMSMSDGVEWAEGV